MGGAPQIVWLRPGVGYSPAAAASMRRLEAALGRPHDCNSSYRDYGYQKTMFDWWNDWKAGRRKDKPPFSRPANPDLSKHPQGLADDSDDWTTPGYIALAAEHGWIRTAASDPTERHHFEYQWWRDQHRNDPAPAGEAEKPKEWDEMATKEEVAEAVRSVVAEEVAEALKKLPKPGLLVIHGTGRAEEANDPRNGRWSIIDGNLEYMTDPSLGFIGSWGTVENKLPLTNLYSTFATNGNPGAFDDLCRILVLDYPTVAPDDYLRAKRQQAGA